MGEKTWEQANEEICAKNVLTNADRERIRKAEGEERVYITRPDLVLTFT